MSRLGRDFYRRGTLTVARELLGKRLVRVIDSQCLSGLVVEVEAYIGEDDAACHAARGRTPRNEAMYGPPGHAYVYCIYGIHHCLNVVTEEEGFPAAVLIRALEPIDGVETMQTLRDQTKLTALTSGPGRLCHALDINRGLDGADLCSPDSELFVEEATPMQDESVAAGPRVGVTGDEAALSAPWRFYLKDNVYVSRR